MHRRMSLGVGLLLLLMFFVGSVSASAEPQAAPEASAVESLDLLDRVWKWLTSLVSGQPTSGLPPEGAHLNGGDGGMFIDPNGNS